MESTAGTIKKRNRRPNCSWVYSPKQWMNLVTNSVKDMNKITCIITTKEKYNKFYIFKCHFQLMILLTAQNYSFSCSITTMSSVSLVLPGNEVIRTHLSLLHVGCHARRRKHREFLHAASLWPGAKSSASIINEMTGPASCCTATPTQTITTLPQQITADQGPRWQGPPPAALQHQHGPLPIYHSRWQRLPPAALQHQHGPSPKQMTADQIRQQNS